jgi:hypothetical protein
LKDWTVWNPVAQSLKVHFPVRNMSMLFKKYWSLNTYSPETPELGVKVISSVLAEMSSIEKIV